MDLIRPLLLCWIASQGNYKKRTSGENNAEYDSTDEDIMSFEDIDTPYAGRDLIVKRTNIVQDVVKGKDKNVAANLGIVLTRNPPKIESLFWFSKKTIKTWITSKNPKAQILNYNKQQLHAKEGHQVDLDFFVELLDSKSGLVALRELVSQMWDKKATPAWLEQQLANLVLKSTSFERKDKEDKKISTLKYQRDVRDANKRQSKKNEVVITNDDDQFVKEEKKEVVVQKAKSFQNVAHKWEKGTKEAQRSNLRKMKDFKRAQKERDAKLREKEFAKSSDVKRMRRLKQNEGTRFSREIIDDDFKSIFAKRVKVFKVRPEPNLDPVSIKGVVSFREDNLGDVNFSEVLRYDDMYEDMTRVGIVTMENFVERKHPKKEKVVLTREELVDIQKFNRSARSRLERGLVVRSDAKIQLKGITGKPFYVRKENFDRIYKSIESKLKLKLVKFESEAKPGEVLSKAAFGLAPFALAFVGSFNLLGLDFLLHPLDELRKKCGDEAADCVKMTISLVCYLYQVCRSRSTMDLLAAFSQFMLAGGIEVTKEISEAAVELVHEMSKEFEQADIIVDGREEKKEAVQDGTVYLDPQPDVLHEGYQSEAKPGDYVKKASEGVVSFHTFFKKYMSSTFAEMFQKFFVTLAATRWLPKIHRKKLYDLVGKPPRMSILEIFDSLLGLVSRMFCIANAYMSGVPLNDYLFKEDPMVAWLEDVDKVIWYESRTYDGLPVAGKKCERQQRVDVQRLIETGKHLKKHYDKKDVKSNALKEKLQKLEGMVINLNEKILGGRRPQPYGVVIAGCAGIGKSNLVHLHNEMWSRAKGRKYDPTHMHSRSRTSKFMDGYNPLSHPLLHYSEIGNESEEHAKIMPSEVFIELNSIADSLPFMCPMAFEDKGKVWACPEYIVVDTNNKDMHIKYRAFCKAAFYRRFAQTVVRVKPEFCIDGGTSLDAQKSWKAGGNMLDRYLFTFTTFTARGNDALPKVLCQDVPLDVYIPIVYKHMQAFIVEQSRVSRLTDFTFLDELVGAVEGGYIPGKVDLDEKNLEYVVIDDKCNVKFDLLSNNNVDYHSDLIPDVSKLTSYVPKEEREYKDNELEVEFKRAEKYLDGYESDLTSDDDEFKLLERMTDLLVEDNKNEYDNICNELGVPAENKSVSSCDVDMFSEANENLKGQKRKPDKYVEFCEKYWKLFLHSCLSLWLGNWFTAIILILFGPSAYSLVRILLAVLFSGRTVLFLFFLFLAKRTEEINKYLLWAPLAPIWRMVRTMAFNRVTTYFGFVARDIAPTPYTYMKISALVCSIVAMRELVKQWNQKEYIAEGKRTEFVNKSVHDEALKQIEEEIKADGYQRVRLTNNQMVYNQLITKDRGSMNSSTPVELRKTIGANVRFVRVRHITDPSVVCTQHLLGIKGSVACMNKHATLGLKEFYVDVYPNVGWNELDKGYTTLHIRMDKCFEFTTDLIAFDTGKISFNASVYKHSLRSKIRKGYGLIEKQAFRTHRDSGSFSIKNDYYPYVVTDPWVYECEHGLGMCGLPLIVQVDKGSAVVGIHAAGGNDDPSCIAIPVDYDLFTKAFEGAMNLSPYIELFSEGNIGQEREVYSRKSPFRYEELHQLTGYGRFKNENILLSKTSKLRKTPYADEVVEKLCETFNFQLADGDKFNKPLMQPRVVDGVYQSPYNRVLKKMNVAPPPLDPNICARVIDILTDRFVKGLEKRGVVSISPLSMTDAINGVENDPFISRINSSTSCGWGLSGLKKEHMPLVGETIREPSLELRANMRKLIEAYKVSEMDMSIVSAQLKDEPRAQSKVDAGNTRAFYMSPLHQLVYNRMLLSPFYSLLCEFNNLFCTAVGINIYTSSHRIFKRFRKFLDYCDGDNWLDMLRTGDLKEVEDTMEGDYGGFDLTMPVEIARSVNTIVYNVLKHFGYSEMALKMTMGLMSDDAFPVVTMLTDVFSRGGLQPSGKYATAENNSIRGLFMLVYAWCSIPELEGADFFEYVLPLTYGDDVIAGVKFPVRHLFNNVVYAHLCEKLFGMEYTTALKGKEFQPFLKLTDVSFLKRKFTYSPIFNRVVAPLALSSIWKTCYWMLPSSAVTQEEQCESMLTSVCWEALFHCETVSQYETFRIWLMSVLWSVFGEDIELPSYAAVAAKLGF